MATDNTYNGWTNYETWLVSLWLDNDQGSYNYWTERAEELWADATPGEYDWQTRESEAIQSFADELKQQHEEQSESLASEGVFADLINAALSEVNWREIAEHYIETAKENNPAEPEEARAEAE